MADAQSTRLEETFRSRDEGARDGMMTRDYVMPTRTTMTTVARNLLQWRFLRMVPDKVLSRLSHMSDRTEVVGARRWCEQMSEDSAAFMNAIDPDLAAEAKEFSSRLTARAERILSPLGHDSAGAADYRLLYFLIRYYQPAHVVETGVAAGFSTQAILSALEENGGDGTLWSSDLPYVRKTDAAAFVGVLVEDHLKSRWHLSLEGDRRSLPRFARAATPIDFVHYDSDKTTRGRNYALRQLLPALSTKAAMLFDDIGDNAHFRKLTTRAAASRVFSVRRKYAGLVEFVNCPGIRGGRC